MTNDNVLEFTGREEISDPLTELLKSGAQIAASRDFVLRTYGGTSADWKVTGSPLFERTFGVSPLVGFDVLQQ